MNITYLIAVIAACLIAGVLAIYLLVRWLQRREPYASFMRLRTRQKLSFFKMLLSDRRVPWFVKAIPMLLIAYLAFPIDIIPDFIPVLGYLDDVGVVLVALVLVIRLTPGQIVLELLERAQNHEEA